MMPKSQVLLTGHDNIYLCLRKNDETSGRDGVASHLVIRLIITKVA